MSKKKPLIFSLFILCLSLFFLKKYNPQTVKNQEDLSQELNITSVDEVQNEVVSHGDVSSEKSIDHEKDEEKVLKGTIEDVYRGYFDHPYYLADAKRTARIKSFFVERKKDQTNVVREALDFSLSDDEILSRQENIFKVSDMKMHVLLSEEQIEGLAVYEKNIPRHAFLSLARQTIGGSPFTSKDAQIARELFVDFSLDHQSSEAGILFLMDMQRPFTRDNIQKRRRLLKDSKEGHHSHMLDLVHQSFQRFFEKIETSDMSSEGKQHYLALQKESEALAEKQLKNALK